MGADADSTTIEAKGAAKQLPACDLVMKGGITSGVVYPGVVMELARKYRFANIGGTSAGAIAAGICAAAEFSRQRGGATDMGKLAGAVEDLQTPGFMVGLFQPTPHTRPLFEVFRNAFSSKASASRRIEEIAIGAAHRRPEVPTIAFILLAGLVTLAIASFSGLPDVLAVGLTLLVALPLALLVVAAMGLVSLGLLVWRNGGALKESGYGFCPGTRQEGRGEDALIDWLHEQIQACAGRKTTDRPLTFGELESEGIRLRMMTTDLSFARPVRIPDDIGAYLFDPTELRQRFPDSVVDAMLPDEARADERIARLRQLMPTEHLPVLVGVRLSLSFPFLLSAIPLYLDDPTTKPQVMCHLFSDGGIASNFPIHFFDGWFPGRPTFGIDLAEHPGGKAEDVFMLTDPAEPFPPRWQAVDSLQAFVGQIVDTMQNWRDNMQSELPGFRDRVCQIRLRRGQGGLYLDMDHELIKTLIGRGHEAGSLILSTFDDHQWEQHRFVRYLTLMAQLQDHLHSVEGPFGEFGPALRGGLPDVTVYRRGRDRDWCERAERATSETLALGAQWGQQPLNVDFCGKDGPLPESTMRVVPRA